MGHRVRTSPRKLPTQGRSKATVDAILAATTRVLIRDGYERASTNRIAKVAGVSVGSLYQYFPSKEALVSAVIDRHCDALMALLTSKMMELAEAPLEVTAREMVKAMLEAHSHEPQLHQVLIEQVPRVGRMARMREIEKRIAEMTVAYLSVRQAEIEPKNLELAAFILVHAVESVSHAILAEPGTFSQEAVLTELTRVVLSYLRPGAVAAKPAAARRLTA